MPQLFVPSANLQLQDQYVQHQNADISIPNSGNPAKALDPVVKVAEKYEQFQMQVKEAEDNATAQDRINQLNEDVNRAQADLQNSEGENEQKLYSTHEENIQEAVKKYGAGLTGNAKLKYQQQASALQHQANAQGYAIHSVKAKQWDNEVRKTSINNSIQDALSFYGTPEFEQRLQDGENQVVDALVVNGRGGDQKIIEEAKRSYRSDVYKAVINFEIDNDRIGSAGDALAKHKDQMDQYTVLELQAKLFQKNKQLAKEAMAERAQKLEQEYNIAKENFNAFVGLGTDAGYDIAKKWKDVIANLHPELAQAYDYILNTKQGKLAQSREEDATAKGLPVSDKDKKIIQETSSYFSESDLNAIQNGLTQAEKTAFERVEENKGFDSYTKTQMAQNMLSKYLDGSDGTDGVVATQMKMDGLNYKDPKAYAKARQEYIITHPQLVTQVNQAVEDANAQYYAKESFVGMRDLNAMNLASATYESIWNSGEEQQSALRLSSNKYSALDAQTQRKIQDMFGDDKAGYDAFVTKFNNRFGKDIIGNEERYQVWMSNVNSGFYDGMSEKEMKSHIEREFGVMSNSQINTVLSAFRERKASALGGAIKSGATSNVAELSQALYGEKEFRSLDPYQQNAVNSCLLILNDEVKKKIAFDKANNPNLNINISDPVTIRAYTEGVLGDKNFKERIEVVKARFAYASDNVLKDGALKDIENEMEIQSDGTIINTRKQPSNKNARNIGRSSVNSQMQYSTNQIKKQQEEKRRQKDEQEKQRTERKKQAQRQEAERQGQKAKEMISNNPNVFGNTFGNLGNNFDNAILKSGKKE